ncbi:MAG TPA: DUF748 domain-containing protein [Candidatus Acidoferrales bacterium]|nr:DUF748 domain-containing protein [Candidatus Acidoferrales bacterium]
MNDRIKRAGEVVKAWGDALVVRLLQASRSRRVRRAGLIAVAVVAVLGIALVVAVPPILRHVLTVQVAKSLERPVRVGRIRFNPLNLRLDVNDLHVGEREGPNPFVDLGHLRVKASWFSIFRLAPVVREVTIERPAFHIVRIDEQHFNFSDLLQSSAPPPAKPPPPSTSAPMRFAVSNIRITNGDIRLDDKLLGQTHHVEKIKLNVPFIANLPADVEIYVQPLLEMVVDGSPLRIAGVTKPFGATHDSVVDLKLHRLDLPLYLGYAPVKLPVAVKDGTLSSDVYVNFVQTEGQPMIRLSGAVAVDALDVRDLGGGPLLALKHAEVKLKDVEPLTSAVYLEAIRIDGLNATVVRNADGTTNLAALTSAPPAPAQQTPATPAPAASATPLPAPLAASAPAPAAAVQTPALDFSLDSFDLTDSVVSVVDRSGATPATFALDGIHVNALNLRNSGQIPATYDIGAKIRSGGALAIKGDLDLVRSQINSEVALDGLDLPALQPFAQQVLAATISSGKFSANAKVATHFASDLFNVHAEPAGLTLDNFRLVAPDGHETPVEVSKLSIAIGQVDLASHNAVVNEIRADGLHVSARRGRNGQLSLAALVRSTPSATPAPRPATVGEVKREVAKPIGPATPPGPSWNFRIESVVVDKTEIRAQDDAARRPIKLALAPLELSVKGVTSDFSKPFSLDLGGTLNGKGTFKVDGTVAIAPLNADLKVATQRLDLSFADAYVSSGLNATITSAMLTMDGAAHVADMRKYMDISYRGDATLGNVTMLDKLTGDSFLKWNALSARKIDFSLSDGPPKAHVGELALTNFYSRIILNSNGKLNLKDIAGSPETAPKSLTRAAGEPGGVSASAPAPTSVPEASAAPAAPPTAQPIAADIELGRITLQGGKIDYTDDFIKPNYTANLTEIAGKVGAFGTKSTEPADVSLDGQINDSAPISIDGSVNPLAPMAFVDLKAKADGIELTSLTPYSAKYTGYPIVKGTLTVDVHYLLDHEKLTADNHIFIDQLTFGDHVESPDATNLPVRLAVALLKNSRGQIDVSVPVSGSLSDPQFSIGSVVLGAFMNLIAKAATSPFSLLAAAFGGGSEDLGNIEFAPGWSKLTPEGQKKLDTVAAAMQDRPALRLNISGRVDPEFDRDGLREAELQQSIDALRTKDAGKEEDSDAEAKPLTKDEYNKYLARVYSAGKFPKPRDVIGLAKSIPPDDMKKLILTNTAVSDDDLRHLADARANAVKRYLREKKVDPARVFVIAPKLNASGISDKSKTTRVDLSLD